MNAGALDAMEVEALVTDRYLEALLAAAERGAPDAPADPGLDPAIRGAARRLRDELVRVHPSFRFEERLARRLAEAAAGMRLAAASGGDATVIPFPVPLLGDGRLADELANPELAALLGAPADAAGAPAASLADRTGSLAARTGSLAARTPPRADGTAPLAGPADATGGPAGRPPASRPLLLGGAVTSAALSLAGAAFVAWRLTRGAPTDPMARAVRLARAARAGRDILPGRLA